MSGRDRMNIQMSVPVMTPAVKWLLIISWAIWFFGQIILENFTHFSLSSIFALTPVSTFLDFHLWQLVTYMFLHSTNQVSHILFNMLMLWFLGCELEQRWGSKFFLTYYLVNGVGAAVIYGIGLLGYSAITGVQKGLFIPVIGASGALFAVMAAYAMVYGERIIYFFMLFPMKAKYFVLILGFVQVASMMTSSPAGTEVAYLAHLGGLISGYAFLLGYRKWQTIEWERKAKKKTRNLRLVVNNDKEAAQDDKGPKYWN